MYIAYIDESGDIGLVNSPTRYFVLACVLVHDSEWLNTLNQLIELRRYLRNTYGINTRTELKANDFVRGHGAWMDWA